MGKACQENALNFPLWSAVAKGECIKEVYNLSVSMYSMGNSLKVMSFSCFQLVQLENVV